MSRKTKEVASQEVHLLAIWFRRTWAHRGNGCCGTPDPWASSTLTAQLDHFAHQCRPRVFLKKQTPKIGCMVHQREWTKY
ncbi:hypothetical protein CEXT_566031 [Caerostris extrusa]|uniref:Uncharacterized protein n=1 Tax=Caerostris extrusa TaxID=172846 RepID=A0AAV4YC20_CAEEX|nr:hypothetical protein CEXT_566031 [Caerostris extrusa]